jgi:hypothetical protein
VISRRTQSANPKSSRTKPLFTRSEGSRAEFVAVEVIRARSLGPLEKTRAFGMTPRGWGASAHRHARNNFRQWCDFTMHLTDESEVIPNEAAFQAEGGISRGVPGGRGDSRKISRPAGENAGRRDDAAGVGSECSSSRESLPANTGAVSRCTQSANPKSSRTKPLFRRSEGSRAEFPGVVVIRARSLGPLEKTRAFGMTQLGWERVHFPTQDTTSDGGVV